MKEYKVYFIIEGNMEVLAKSKNEAGEKIRTKLLNSTLGPYMNYCRVDEVRELTNDERNK